MPTTPANEVDRRRLQATRQLLGAIANELDIDLSVRLWDGSLVPLGKNANSGHVIAIRHPGVVASILRRPGLDRVVRHYAAGMIDFEGGTLVDIGRHFAFLKTRGALKRIPKRTMFDFARAFLFAEALPAGESRAYAGGGEGIAPRRSKADDKDFIGFHYDLSNEFYQLFLDRQMVYSCAYFTDWSNDIDRAQHDKLEMICRKLRLQPGERFLDIGCGWGALVCHAAREHGVTAHGVTLSERQLEVARRRIEEQGLQDRVTVELKNYNDLTGQFDKIASIGMAEHVGLANLPTYMATVNRLLVDKGLFLNHAITHKARKRQGRFATRPEHKAILKYIFPGGELDDIGHTCQLMERHGFEVMDVEGWREHYQLATELWCRRLTDNKAAAVALVGDEAYRIWAAYLGGVSLAFLRGTLRLYQTLASKNAKGPSKLPPTRADLYR